MDPSVRPPSCSLPYSSTSSFNPCTQYSIDTLLSCNALDVYITSLGHAFLSFIITRRAPAARYLPIGAPTGASPQASLLFRNPRSTFRLSRRFRSNGSLNEPRTKGGGEERGFRSFGRPRGGGDEGDGASQEENTSSLRQVLVLKNQVQWGAPLVSARPQLTQPKQPVRDTEEEDAR